MERGELIHVFSTRSMRRLSDAEKKTKSQRVINDPHEEDSAYASPPALNDHKS